MNKRAFISRCVGGQGHLGKKGLTKRNGEEISPSPVEAVVNFTVKFCRDARWDVVSKAIDVLTKGFVKKQFEDIVWGPAEDKPVRGAASNTVVIDESIGREEDSPFHDKDGKVAKWVLDGLGLKEASFNVVEDKEYHSYTIPGVTKIPDRHIYLDEFPFDHATMDFVINQFVSHETVVDAVMGDGQYKQAVQDIKQEPPVRKRIFMGVKKVECSPHGFSSVADLQKRTLSFSCKFDEVVEPDIVVEEYSDPSL